MEPRALAHRAGRATAQLALVGAVVLAAAAPAYAAKPSHAGGGGSGGGGGGAGSSTPIGNDVSYPQCGGSLPASPAFGIVGVNDGLANDLNPCLGPSPAYPSYAQSELYWAVASSTGTSAQPKASLYVNTADPGNAYNGAPIGDWPTSSLSSDPYGSCTTSTVTLGSGTYVLGQNSTACAWQYGYDKAAQDAAWLTSAADAVDAQSPPTPVATTPGSYPWWLDVETANTWQSGTSGQAMNVADLQGMIAAFQVAGATSVGAYSTSSQWDAVTGGTTAASGALWGIPDWVPGAKKLSQAESTCSQASFTGGSVTVTQWSGRIDNDYAC